MSPALLLAGLLILAAPPQEETPAAGAPLERFQTALEAVLDGGDPAVLHALGTTEFQAAVSAAQLGAGLRQILRACASPPLPLAVDPPGWRREGFQHVLVGRGRAREVVFRVSFDEAGRIAGLRSRLAAVPRPLGELLEELRDWSGDLGVAAVRTDADGRVLGRLVLHRGGPAFPLGSLFKVYVLAELARQEAAGRIRPEQEVALREEWKSLPSGRLQAEAAGSTWTVAELARRMIRESDNTATDHLLQLLGREAVEAILPLARNSVPERNRPFLSTWELFRLKALPEAAAAFDGDLEALARAWATAGVPGRRRLLAAAMAALDPEAEPAELRSRAIMGYQLRTLAAPGHRAIEWFAAPEDLTALFLAAWQGELVDAETSRRFREGLGRSLPLYEGPGIQWQGFKGGSETGVLTFAVLVELADGGAVAVCVCREGFPPLDPGVTEATTEFTTSLLRAAAEGHLPLQAPATALRLQ